MKVKFHIYLIQFLFSYQSFAQPALQSPDQLYGALFEKVQSSGVFSDSKTFADAVPLFSHERIMSDYTALQDTSVQGLKRFVAQHFSIPADALVYVSDSAALSDHVTKLWNTLRRPAGEQQAGSLIALPYPYIVPGGRFREMYYWDSYFTMLGLKADGRVNDIQHLVDDFSWLLDTYGFIPNGTRTYYLSRSQPPFYALMIDLLAGIQGDQVYGKYLPQLLKEYRFWMDGQEKLSLNTPAFRRVVRMPDGSVLNRYWDDRAAPRPESYREDVQTAAEAAVHGRTDREKLYRDLRAAAESGWDFSSRWLTPDSNDHYDLHSIRTTDIVPVDLNALLYHLEGTLAKAFQRRNDTSRAKEFLKKAQDRKEALLRYGWNKETAFFMDWNLQTRQSTACLSLAGVYPLFFQMATEEQAKHVMERLDRQFLKSGGMVTTLKSTGEQWDAPNGWAPLQWICIVALRHYGQHRQAEELKKRWLSLNEKVYRRNWKMLEKYNVEQEALESGGGEYPTQDGFGWTNGVYQSLKKEQQ